MSCVRAPRLLTTLYFSHVPLHHHPHHTHVFRTLDAGHHSGNMQFRLLDLPAELRNEIYGLALQRSGPLHVVRTWIRHHYALKLERSTFTPALLATCRAINTEATPILYGGSTYDD